MRAIEYDDEPDTEGAAGITAVGVLPPEPRGEVRRGVRYGACSGCGRRSLLSTVTRRCVREVAVWDGPKWARRLAGFRHEAVPYCLRNSEPRP